jgi:hypothetical protein
LRAGHGKILLFDSLKMNGIYLVAMSQQGFGFSYWFKGYFYPTGKTAS